MATIFDDWAAFGQQAGGDGTMRALQTAVGVPQAGLPTAPVRTAAASNWTTGANPNEEFVNSRRGLWNPSTQDYERPEDPYGMADYGPNQAVLDAIGFKGSTRDIDPAASLSDSTAGTQGPMSAAYLQHMQQGGYRMGFDPQTKKMALLGPDGQPVAGSEYDAFTNDSDFMRSAAIMAVGAGLGQYLSAGQAAAGAGPGFTPAGTMTVGGQVVTPAALEAGLAAANPAYASAVGGAYGAASPAVTQALAAAGGAAGAAAAGGGTTQLTPAAMESMIGTPGYGANAAADAIVGAGNSGMNALMGFDSIANPAAWDGTAPGSGGGSTVEITAPRLPPELPPTPAPGVPPGMPPVLPPTSGSAPAEPADYSNEGRNYPTPESTQGPGGSPINASTGLPGVPPGWLDSIPKSAIDIGKAAVASGLAGAAAGSGGGAGANTAPITAAAGDMVSTGDQFRAEQLALLQGLYDDNKAVADQVVDSQLQTMRSAQANSDDLMARGLAGLDPLQKAISDQVLQDNTARDAAERDAIVAANNQLATDTRTIQGDRTADSLAAVERMTGDLSGINSRYRDETQAILSGLDQRFAGYEAAMGKAGGAADAAMQAALARANGAAGGITANSARHEAEVRDAINLYTSGNSAIREKYGKDIEADAELALADVRAGQSSALGQAMRQAMRYGLNTSSIAGQQAHAAAQAQAAAVNNTRRASTDQYRGLVGQGVGMRQNLMSSSNQAAIAAANAELGAAQVGMSGARLGYDMASDRARFGADGARLVASTGLDLSGRYADADSGIAGQRFNLSEQAKNTDTAAQLAAAQIMSRSPSMARDLRVSDDQRTLDQRTNATSLYNPFLSQAGSWAGVASGAGTSALANRMLPGNQMFTQRTGADTMSLTARQQAMAGLIGGANAANGAANVDTQRRGQNLDLAGTIGGFVLSDRRAKRALRRVGTHRIGVPLYRFRYAWGGPEQEGVMAQDVLQVRPEAVAQVAGMLAVNYSAI